MQLGVDTRKILINNIDSQYNKIWVYIRIDHREHVDNSLSYRNRCFLFLIRIRLGSVDIYVYSQISSSYCVVFE